jgi:hypothetical protein
MSLLARKDRQRLQRLDYATLSGTADIDVSAAVYTALVDLITITPNAEIQDLIIDLDFDKATTGVNEVATASDTLNCAVFVAVDGTNYVGVQSMPTVTMSGTAGTITGGVIGGYRFKLGYVGASTVVKVRVSVSAERADAEIPYVITYQSLVAPTVTAVAAA